MPPGRSAPPTRESGHPLGGGSADRGRRARVGRDGRRLDPEEPFPADTETRLAQFTELLATAISNAEARADASRLAEEQAALRRVATLVARESSPAEVFAAVAKEVAGLLGVDDMRMVSYEADGDGHRGRGVGRARRRLPGRLPPAPRAGRTSPRRCSRQSGRPHRDTRRPPERSGPTRAAGNPLRGRRSDHRRRTPLGRHGRDVAGGRVAAGGHRVAPGELHRAGRDGDLEHRGAGGAGGVAGADRGGGRRGAPAGGSRSARRSAAAPGPHDHHAQAGPPRAPERARRLPPRS